MMFERETIVPYALAGAVIALVALLVTIDVVAALPDSPPKPAPAKTEKAERHLPTREVQNLVLFTKVEFKDTTVMTGVEYKTPEAREPSEQWCYIERLVQTDGAARKVTLGTKSGAEAVKWLRLDPQAAADIGYSLSDLETARGKCRFAKSSTDRS